jgi:UDP-N-acetylglucosamine 2-epimerase (non-hydrolysing)
MADMVRVAAVAGARPNFVKIAPLMRAMRGRPDLQVTLINTGQHYDPQMSDDFFRDLDIQAADFSLGVGSASHAIQTAEVMRRLEPVLEAARPEVVLVVGDVNSTMAAAITAVKLGLPVAHVEAGLRSFDRTMPEEINRLITDAISDFLFVTEQSACENLSREGIPSAKVHFVGNVMIDALEATRPRWTESTIVSRLGIDAAQPYAVLTLHRPSNVDDPAVLVPLLDALRKVAEQLPLVFPVHPRLRARLGDAIDVPGFLAVEALPYLDFIALLSRARLVLTDSGGVQEETTVLGVPCLTLRSNTERPVTVTHGTNRVIGNVPAVVTAEALDALERAPRRECRPPLWDGQAAVRIADIIARRTLRRNA